MSLLEGKLKVNTVEIYNSNTLRILNNADFNVINISIKEKFINLVNFDRNHKKYKSSNMSYLKFHSIEDFLKHLKNLI